MTSEEEDESDTLSSDDVGADRLQEALSGNAPFLAAVRKDLSDVNMNIPASNDVTIKMKSQPPLLMSSATSRESTPSESSDANLSGVRRFNPDMPHRTKMVLRSPWREEMRPEDFAVYLSGYGGVPGGGTGSESGYLSEDTMDI